ncbi:MAG: amidohydrolase [Sphaerisporangium sp.]|nr:amidohydrolase [Sphaerisporangium sp.]
MASTTRPILLTGGTVITMDPRLGDWERADVLIGGSVIVGVGPGLLTAAVDDNMIVIDCAGMIVIPASGTAGTLTPGEAADIAALRIANSHGRHLELVVTAGRVTRPNEPGMVANPDHPYLGIWVDENDFVRQELLPDGRYDEARGDRPSAYQGRYWINGNRIDYLDDLGFWAYGEFHDGVLHHAGYRFERRQP